MCPLPLTFHRVGEEFRLLRDARELFVGDELRSFTTASPTGMMKTACLSYFLFKASALGFESCSPIIDGSLQCGNLGSVAPGIVANVACGVAGDIEGITKPAAVSGALGCAANRVQ